MEIDYLYTKLRKNFGRQYFFFDDGPRIVEELKPNKALAANYIIKNPAHKGTQCGTVMSENQANTQIVDYSDHGMNHLEGGWPKEVDTNDEEAVLRFRKKAERLDNYIFALKHLTVPMEHAILQNNAVNIYEQYFVGTETAISCERATSRIQNTFRDPRDVKRPITHCSWSPFGNEFAISHCNMNFQRLIPDQALECYIWDIENPNTPVLTLEGKCPVVTLEYNPKDPHFLAAGMYSGQVAAFDARKGAEPTSLSIVESSHRDPTHSLLWINSKSGMEFFTTSGDGTVRWWDLRKLDEPYESIILDLTKGEKPSMARTNPASCLEYEPSIPVKYMVGTEHGYIICGNRKGTSHQEKLPWIMKCHLGSIYNIHRNQAFTKNFLSVGDWTARIWSEDCKESAIMWTSFHKTRLTDGEWSAGRASVFFLTREDGVLDLWDILQEQGHAFMSMKLSTHPLTSVRVREDGELVVATDTNGSAYVVRYSSSLAESSKNDKVFLSAMFDRESHREKLLEVRNREIRFRLREIAAAKEAAETEEEKEYDKTDFEVAVENYLSALESDYLAAIEKTLSNYQKLKEGTKPEAPPEEEAEIVEEEVEEVEEQTTQEPQ